MLSFIAKVNVFRSLMRVLYQFLSTNVISNEYF